MEKKEDVKMWGLDGLMDEVVERVIQIAADGDISSDELVSDSHQKVIGRVQFSNYIKRLATLRWATESNGNASVSHA
jgi:hypothetical protein